MAEFAILLILATCAAIAWLAPVVDMQGEKVLDGRVFWIAMFVGLLVASVLWAARAVWRKTRGL